MKYIQDIYTAKIYHWLMFRKYNNLGFLQLNSINKIPKRVTIDEKEINNALDVYHSIYDQILDDFSVDESLVKQREHEEEIARLQLGWIITGDAFKQTMYELKEAEKPKKEEINLEYDFNKELGIVSKSMGSGIIDIKNTTIHQYHTAINLLKNG